MGGASTCDADVPGMGLPRMVTRWMCGMPGAPGCGLGDREHCTALFTALRMSSVHHPAGLGWPGLLEAGVGDDGKRRDGYLQGAGRALCLDIPLAFA